MLTRKIAFIDLTEGTVTQEEIPIEWRRAYLGARGINMFLLRQLIESPCDPLRPENPLIFGAGLLTGSLGFGAGRFNITALSPACGNIGDSNCGGHFGAQLAYAGFHHLVIRGKSATPVYLLVTDDRIDIRDARHLWGRDSLLPYSVGMAACTACGVHCRHRHVIREGRFRGTRGEGPEYGAIMGVGLESGNFDLESVIYASNLCNRLGLDVTHAGMMINFAMELSQRGIIDERDTGMELTGGSRETILRLLQDMAHRNGFGDILAEGGYALERLPPEAAPFLCKIKNMPAGPPGIDVLHLPPEVLEDLYGGPVSPDFSSYEGKARMVWWHELLYAVCDALGCCRFQTVFNSPHAPQYEEYRELIRLSTGLDMPVAELKEIAERIYTTERLLLMLFGVGSRRHDALPDRWVSEPGPGRIDRGLYEKFLDDYYALHGWDAEGHPTPQGMDRLGLGGLRPLLHHRRPPIDGATGRHPVTEEDK